MIQYYIMYTAALTCVFVMTLSVTSSDEILQSNKRNTDSCDTKIQRLSDRVNRRFKHLEDLIHAEKTNRLKEEIIQKLREELKLVKQDELKSNKSEKLFLEHKSVNNVKLGLGAKNPKALKSQMAVLQAKLNTLEKESQIRNTELLTRLNGIESNITACIKQCGENTDTDNCSGNMNSTCELGTTTVKDDMNLEDDDICMIGNGGCEHYCNKTQYNYTCWCMSGYTQDVDDFHKCNDINECALTSNCHHHCHNTPGSYACTCNQGYMLDQHDRKTCRDINECLSDNGGCDHICTNTQGTYTCACREGYILNAVDLHSCKASKEIDECALKPAVCHHLCHDTSSSYYCTCNHGYMLDRNDTRTCRDIDECALTPRVCNHRCHNTDGSYVCSCNHGYSLDTNDMKTCKDQYDATWFRANVRLCFRWYADDKGEHQCHDGQTGQRETCAHVGSLTDYYLDNTVGKSGGCRMAWGLKPVGDTKGWPLWISGMQICFRWYESRGEGQCSAVGMYLCAKFGKFTTFYRDNTGGRGEGCHMSWTLKLPRNSPSWARETKLCFHYKATGDKGQCRKGGFGSQCRKANRWTTYYIDNTDSRSGGCQMRWGLLN